MSFIGRYVYTYEELVFVTEATAVQQNITRIIKRIRNNNVHIDNCMYMYIMDSFMYRYIMCN